MSQTLAVLLLGSNLGNRKINIELALNHIETFAGLIVRKSEILETDPVEYDSNKKFCNIAVGIQTSFSPVILLKKLKNIERQMGRLEDSAVSGSYSDRIIDIDIVLYGGLNFTSSKLSIPHKKHLIERDFSKQLISSIIRQ